MIILELVVYHIAYAFVLLGRLCLALRFMRGARLCLRAVLGLYPAMLGGFEP